MSKSKEAPFLQFTYDDLCLIEASLTFVNELETVADFSQETNQLLKKVEKFLNVLDQQGRDESSLH